MSVDLSVLIPAQNEVGYIEPCLEALLQSEDVPGAVEVIVVANGCTDATAAASGAFATRFAEKRWGFRVLELHQRGKISALNSGDAAATYGARVYLDADVVVSRFLLAQLADALDTGAPRYASGRPVVTVGAGGFSGVYTRFWEQIPFVTHGVPGFGVFAVNAAGRLRWGRFPDIISDDTFVRLSFSPSERHGVPARYAWPMIEGFRPLVRVRRRQDIGVAEVKALYPQLWKNRDPVPVDARRFWLRALRDPLGFAAFATVGLAVRLPRRGEERWARGR